MAWFSVATFLSRSYPSPKGDGTNLDPQTVSQWKPTWVEKRLRTLPQRGPNIPAQPSSAKPKNGPNLRRGQPRSEKSFLPLARPLLASATHLGIEGSGLLQLGPAEGLAEGVPEEASILMHHLPGLLKQLLFIRDAWQTKERWRQVSEGQGGPPLPHPQGMREKPSHSLLNRSMEPTSVSTSQNLNEPRSRTDFTHRPTCPETEKEPSETQNAREHRHTHPEGQIQTHSLSLLPTLSTHPLGST